VRRRCNSYPSVGVCVEFTWTLYEHPVGGTCGRKRQSGDGGEVVTRDDGGWGHTGAVTKDTQKETDKLRAAEAQRAAKEEALRRARDEQRAAEAEAHFAAKYARSRSRSPRRRSRSRSPPHRRDSRSPPPYRRCAHAVDASPGSRRRLAVLSLCRRLPPLAPPILTLRRRHGAYSGDRSPPSHRRSRSRSRSRSPHRDRRSPYRRWDPDLRRALAACYCCLRRRPCRRPRRHPFPLVLSSFSLLSLTRRSHRIAHPLPARARGMLAFAHATV